MIRLKILLAAAVIVSKLMVPAVRLNYFRWWPGIKPLGNGSRKSAESLWLNPDSKLTDKERHISGALIEIKVVNVALRHQVFLT